MGLIYDREFTELEKSQMISTGQMIDTLDRGQIAECLTGFYEGSKVIRTDLDEIVFTGSMDFLMMTTFARGSRWILKKRKKRE